MKKQLLLLSLGLLLASCGTTAPAASSQPAADTTATSTAESAPAGESTPAETSSEAAKTTAQLVNDLFGKIAQTGNCTFEISGQMSFKSFGGDKGMLIVYDASQLNSSTPYTGIGYARLTNYGIVSYYYKNETAGVDASTTTIVSPNKNVKFEEFDNSAKELGECGKVVPFTESARTHTLTTTDTDFMGALLTFLGEDSEDLMDNYTTVKATASLSDDKKEITLSYVLKGASDTTNYPDVSVTGLTISDIGTTKDTAVDAYLASNVTLTAPTTWDATTLSLWNSVSTGLTVPFPTGATYAASMPASYQSSMQGYLVFRDLGSGNILTSYGQALAAAGFTYDSANSGTSSGMTVAYYEKSFAGASALEGPTTLTLALLYQTATGDDAKFYPNGVFAVYAFVEQEAATVTQAQLNAHLATFKLPWSTSTNAFPTLDFGSNCTKIEFMDEAEYMSEYLSEYYTSTYQSYGYNYTVTVNCDIYAMINVYYATEAEANALVTSLNSTLTAAGWTASQNSDNAYYKYDQTSGVEVDFDFDVAKENNVYKGYVQIVLDIMSMTVA